MISDSELRSIYANSPVEKTYFEVISFESEQLSKTYYLQSQVMEDIDVTLEDQTVVTAQYVPMSIGKSSNNEDLNSQFSIEIQTVNDEIANEISNYDFSTGTGPRLVSRVYILYRDLTVSSIKQGPVSLEIQEMERNTLSTKITVSNKPANLVYTGEKITANRFPSMRGIVS